MDPPKIQGADFFYEQKSEDLFLVMARVTNEEQAHNWLAIYDVMENVTSRASSKTYSEARTEIRRILMEEMPGKMLCRRTMQVGAGCAGQGTIMDALSSFGTERPIDLWIAYAWSSTSLPTYPIKPVDVLKVELIMTVTTAAPYLYTWHMGITRSFLWKYYEQLKFHARISVGLHCFAAKVMKQQYGRSLRYVRSNLANQMSGLLENVLRPYIGSRVFFNNEEPVLVERNGRVILYELPKEGQMSQVAWEGPQELFDWPRYPGSYFNVRFIADIELLGGL